MNNISRFIIIAVALVIYFIAHFYFKLDLLYAILIEIAAVFIMTFLLAWYNNRPKK